MQTPTPISPDSLQATKALVTSESLKAGLGIATAVIGALIYDYIKSRDKVTVKLITKSTDKDVESFVELYNQLFDESVRIDASEIICWIDEDCALRRIPSHTYYHYLLVCKLRGQVVGFIKLMYELKSKYAFIAYYGIDTSTGKARRVAAPALLKSMKQLIDKEMKECKAVLFELQAPDPSLDVKENRERRARIRLFKEEAKRQNFMVYELKFDYFQPLMEVSYEDEDSVSEECLVLMYIPIKDPNPIPKKLSASKVLEILHFIYLQIYRPTFRHDPIQDGIYQTYLNGLLDLYKTELPDTIDLIN